MPDVAARWRIGALAGTGTGRKRILPALRDSPLCAITVVQGRDPGRLAEFTRADPAIHAVTDADAFAALADAFDVVYVGSPPYLHREHIELAAGLGKPILCEKPLALTAADAEAIERIVADAGVRLAVAHQVRHQQVVDDLLALVAGGELGEVRDSHLQWDFLMDMSAPNAAWKLDPALGGASCMWDCGVHALDLAVLLFGAPRAVAAVGQRRRTERVMDAVTAVLDYGTHLVTIAASQSAAPHANDLTITGTGATVRVAGLLGERPARQLRLDPRDEVRTYPAGNLYRSMVEDFCRSLDGAPQRGTTLPQAVATTAVLRAIDRAVRDPGVRIAVGAEAG